jgi:hypothetical protein
MRRLVVILVLGLAVVVAATVAITLAVTGDGDDEEAAETRLTRAEWERAVVDAGARSSADFDTLEDLARDDCEQDEDGWALDISMRGADAAISRLGLQYLCPERVKVFDAGKDQLEESVGEVDLACDTPPGDRTEEQQQLAEAMRC